MTDELERIAAERACERLIVEYSRRIDFGEAGRIAELFTEDGRWEGTDLLLEGREEIARWFAKREAVTRRVSRHVCTNVAVELLRPDEAIATSYLVNFRHDRSEEDGDLPVPSDVPKWVADLHDRFRRTPDGWRFSERRVDVTFARASSRRA